MVLQAGQIPTLVCVIMYLADYTLYIILQNYTD